MHAADKFPTLQISSCIYLLNDLHRINCFKIQEPAQIYQFSDENVYIYRLIYSDLI